MEIAIKNCSDDKFSESNIRTLLNRISYGFDITSNAVFFQCTKEELLCKKNELIIEYARQGIMHFIIRGQFGITQEELDKILNETSINLDKKIKEQKTKKRLLKELELLEQKELFYEKKMKLLDEKISLIDEKLDILNNRLSMNDIKKLLLENN